MKRDWKSIILGLFILVASIVALYLVFFKNPTEDEFMVVDESETSVVKNTIEDTFKVQIPESADIAELKSSTGYSGIAAREIIDGVITFTILADLSDPVDGEYSVYLAKGNVEDVNYSEIFIGSLHLAKGGYLLDYSSSEDLSEYDKVIVKLGDEIILSGIIKEQDK